MNNLKFFCLSSSQISKTFVFLIFFVGLLNTGFTQSPMNEKELQQLMLNGVNNSIETKSIIDKSMLTNQMHLENPHISNNEKAVFRSKERILTYVKETLDTEGKEIIINAVNRFFMEDISKPEFANITKVDIINMGFEISLIIDTRELEVSQPAE